MTVYRRRDWNVNSAASASAICDCNRCAMGRIGNATDRDPPSVRTSVISFISGGRRRNKNAPRSHAGLLGSVTAGVVIILLIATLYILCNSSQVFGSSVNIRRWHFTYRTIHEPFSGPFKAYCCHMGTAIKHPVPDRVKPPFVIFDIWALWRSILSVRR